MFYQNKKWLKLFLFSFLLHSATLLANGGGGEEKKAEGAPSAEAVDKEFSKAQLKLQNLSVRQEEYRKQIDELTEKRRTAKSKADQKALRQQMVEIEKNQKKEIKEIEELKIQLKYRFPDFGEMKQRGYATERRKPAMEPDTDGLKDVLTSTKRSIDEQYKKPSPTEPATETDHAPKSKADGGH